MNWFDENATALIAAGSALLSAIVAGGFAIFASWLNNMQNNARLINQLQHEISKENRRLFIEKGEELYVSVNKWFEHVNAHFLAEDKFAKKEINQEQMRALLKDYPVSESYLRVETLTSLFFPELKEILSAARTARSKAYFVLDTLEKDSINNQKAAELLTKCNVQYDIEVEKYMKALQHILLAQIKK